MITRQTVEVTERIETPWGPADFATLFAEGITFYSTPGHGGFRLSPERNAVLLAKFPGFRTFSGAIGWYEEDCDWAAVALAFPEAFPEVAPSEAQGIFDSYLANRLPSKAAVCNRNVEDRNVEGQDWICTGNFDGFTCGSDADSGL